MRVVRNSPLSERVRSGSAPLHVTPSLSQPIHFRKPTPPTMMTRLDNLPTEILLEILGYSLVAHNRCPTSTHPLNAVASANKQLYAVVEEYTRSLLKQHVHFTPPKSSKTFSCRKKWLAETCQFCSRKSQRRAILYASLTCCRLCDKQYFPKIVRFPARTRTYHGLKMSDYDGSDERPRPLEARPLHTQRLTPCPSAFDNRLLHNHGQRCDYDPRARRALTKSAHRASSWQQSAGPGIHASPLCRA